MSITIEGFLVAAISDADLFSAFLKLTLTMILSPEVNTSLSATEELLNNKLFSRVDLLVVVLFLSLFFLVFFDFFVGFPVPAALLLGSSSLMTLRLFEVLFLEVFLDFVLTGDREIDRDLEILPRFLFLLLDVLLVRDLDLLLFFLLFFLFGDGNGTGETDCCRRPIRPIRLLIGDLETPRRSPDQDRSDLLRVVLLRDRDLNGERDFDLESDLDRDRLFFLFLFLDRDLLAGSGLLGSGDLDLLGGGDLEADDLERLDTGDLDRLGIGNLDFRGGGDFETLFDNLGLDRDLERERDGGDLDFEPWKFFLLARESLFALLRLITFLTSYLGNSLCLRCLLLWLGNDRGEDCLEKNIWKILFC